MDKVSIPEQDVIPLETIAPDVHGLRVMIVNVYAIRNATGQWMLIDCGLPYSEARIRGWAEEHFGKDSRPSAIFLTHGHFDHTGVVEDLARQWDVPVYAHPLEMPYLTGKSEYPPPNPSVGGGLMALMSRLFPRGPVNLGDRVRELPSDGTVPNFPDWRWIQHAGA